MALSNIVNMASKEQLMQKLDEMVEEDRKAYRENASECLESARMLREQGLYIEASCLHLTYQTVLWEGLGEGIISYRDVHSQLWRLN